MRVTVAVLAFNRLHLLKRTLASMDADPGAPFARVLVDGGSHDVELRAFVAERGGLLLGPPSATVAHNTNVAIGLALETDPDLVVFSADDMEYKPRWLERLLSFWRAVPDSIPLASLNWEPLYPWNVVQKNVMIGGERTLIRPGIPGSSLSFRAEDWAFIGPMRGREPGTEDKDLCKRMAAMGYKLAALDLADHIGERESTWGNMAWTHAQPLVLDWSQ